MSLARQMHLDLDTSALRKARGAFFTPPALSEFIVQWAVRTASDVVLEPSCGEAAFLLPAARRLRGLGAIAPDVHGVDLHGPSIAEARELMRASGFKGELQTADFFEVAAEPRYDAVVGNPPYVRYQGLSDVSRELAIRAAASQGVRLDRLSNIWAAFVVHAATSLAPGGRLGMVLPATLLTAGYAEPVRSFLLRRFSSVTLVMFERRVFPGVQEEVVLLLAEGEGGTDRLHVAEVEGADDLSDLDVWRNASPTPAPSSKWTSALIDASSRDAYLDISRSPHFELLGEWGRVDLGMVTGNNKYFMLSPSEASEHGIPPSELLRACPPGARSIPGISFSSRAWSDLGSSGGKTMLFYPSDSPSDAALSYIAAGDRAGVSQGYKCRKRSPWWRVPLVEPPHLFLTYMSGVAPRFVSNRARARHVNSLHGVVLKKGRVGVGQAWIPLAALNSVTLLGAELVGRSYGGGVLKIEPREAIMLPVPSLDALEGARDELRTIRDQVATDLRLGDIESASKKVDEKLLVRSLGIQRKKLRSVRSALRQLRERRGSRGRQ